MEYKPILVSAIALFAIAAHAAPDARIMELERELFEARQSVAELRADVDSIRATLDAAALDGRVKKFEAARRNEWQDPQVHQLDTDVLVAVSTNSTNANYIGDSGSTGVLRTDSTLTYDASGIDWVTLGVSSSVTNTDDQEITTFSVITNTLIISLERDATSPHSVDLTSYVGGSTTGITSHVLLSNLLWTGSGHYGTSNRVAAFDSVGAPTYIDYSEWNAMVAYSNSAAFTADVRASQTNDGFEANTDALVGVTSGSTPNYLGSLSNNGVLRTDISIEYSAALDWVTLGVNADWFETNVINTVSNTFDIAVVTVDEVCDQNTHPYDTDDDSTGSGGGEDGGTTHPDDDSSGGSYPGGGTDEDDGTDHPSTDDCYSTVPDSIP